MTNSSSQHSRHCLIVGAGMGGLTAAAALSHNFERVTLLEKDSLPMSPTGRKSTVQAYHLHSLLIAGQQILEKYLPGISDDLVANGAVKLRAGLDQNIHEFGTWMPKRDLGLDILAQSRHLLEFVVRERVLAIDNVLLKQNTRVLEPLIEAGRLTGVLIAGADGNSETIHADAVVDASGLSCALTGKLASIIPEIETQKETVQSKIVYVSAYLEKPANWLHTRENVLVVAEPHQTCGGALLDIENNTWCVSLTGRNGLEPPTDPDGWKAFASGLTSQAIWERVKDCDIKHKLHKFKKPVSYLRRFDKIDNLPLGFFPLGDTISSINPTFGQGMAVALGHADRLAVAFSQISDDHERQKHYLASATEWSKRAWRQTVAYESMFSESEQTRAKFKALQALVLNKHKQAQHDPTMHLQLFKQAQMLA